MGEEAAEMVGGGKDRNPRRLCNLVSSLCDDVAEGGTITVEMMAAATGIETLRVMRKGGFSLRDAARESGYAVSTVSEVASGTYKGRPETGDAITRTLERLAGQARETVGAK